MQKKDKSINHNSKAIELLALGLDLLEGKPGGKGEKGDTGEQGPAGKDSTVPGPKGDKGDIGPKGADGKDGKTGPAGKDGKDGEQGPKGDKGDTGPQGPKGEDAKPVTPEVILEVTTPLIIQNVQKAVASKTVSASEVDGLAEFVAQNSASSASTFETVSKNLDASGATLNYTGDNLTSIEYANGITKTLNYTGDNLTSVVLSGSTPAGIDLTKTLSYTGDNLTGVVYS